MNRIECSSLRELAGSLPLVLECSSARNGALRLTTPFVYPNGEHIEVFLDAKGSLVPSYYLSDYGHTASLLKHSQISATSTHRKRQVVHDIVEQLDVAFVSGALLVSVDADDRNNFNRSLFQLAQACVRLADFATHQRLRTVNAFRDDVEDFFEAREFTYVPDVWLQGPYSREIRVDFEVNGIVKKSLVQVLGSVNEASSHTSTNEILRKWLDIRKTGNYDKHQFVTVCNSSSRNLRDDDAETLRDFSNVVWYPEESDWLDTLLRGTEAAAL